MNAVGQAEDTSLLELADVLLRRWTVVVGLPVLAAAISVGVALLLPARYTAAASFLPEAQADGLSAVGGLGGIAARFGVTVPGASGESPAFYAALLESRTLRDQALLTGFPDPRSDIRDSVVLLDLLRIDRATLAERLELGREKLSGITSISVNDETGVVTVAVETPYPSLSANVANRFLELVNHFNLSARQTRALERRRFIEGRLRNAARDLRDSEEALKRFLQGNRQWTGSAELVFEHDRLERQVTLKQEVLGELQRSYEQARIQEVNDTPVITTIERAMPPVQKSRPRRRLIVILSVVAGSLFGVSAAFAKEFLERARRQRESDYEQLASSWAALKSQVRSLLTRS